MLAEDMGFWVRYADFITHGTAKHHHHICVSFHCKWLRWMPTHTENCVIGNKPQAFPHSSVGKESTCSEGDLGSIPGLRRSPGKGKGYPLQYSGLESSMDCIVMELQRVGRDWATSLYFALCLVCINCFICFKYLLLSLWNLGYRLTADKETV